MRQRRYDYDILRVTSMLSVIYLHTAASALQLPENQSLWNFSNFLTAFATPSVPIFFMISGALLLSQPQTSDIGHLFRTRLPRVLLPLCTWTGVVLVYSFLTDPSAALASTLRLLSTPVIVPYWFLYALIPMYLLSPLLKQMVDGLQERHWDYMMALWGVLTLGLYTVRIFLPTDWQQILMVHYTLNLNMIGGYLGYFLLGTYLERRPLPSKKLLCGLFAVCIAVSVLGTRWDTYAHGAYSDRFTNYLTLFTMLLSVSIFLLAKSCLRGERQPGRLLTLLSGISFPVYLIHPLAIGVGEKIWPFLFGTTGPGTIPQQVLFYGGVVLLCIAASVVMSSIPGVCFLCTGQSFSAASRSCNLQFLFAGKKAEKG